jgi:hypothetical protein
MRARESAPVGDADSLFWRIVRPVGMAALFLTLWGLADAIRYFEILPRAIQEEQKVAAKAKLVEFDKAEKEWAEEQSNCGRAEKDENGRWVPVMNEELDWMDNSGWREALQNV